MLGHGVDQLRFTELRIVEVQALVEFLAAAQQLPGRQAQFAQQFTQLRGVERAVQVAQYLDLEAAGFEQLKGCAGFRTARVVQQAQFAHHRVARAGKWRVF